MKSIPPNIVPIVALSLFAFQGTRQQGAISRHLVEKAVGCVARDPDSEMDPQALQLGQMVNVRAKMGTIPGTSPDAPDRMNLMITDRSDKKGEMSFVIVAHDGGITVIRNEYYLRSDDGEWSAGEGNGGVGTYTAISHYAANLSKLPPIRMKLVVHRDGCRQTTY